MHLHFQGRPWDLLAVVIYCTVTSIVLLVLNIDDRVAILLVLFAPGYVVVAALFPTSLSPERLEIDWIERFALSFGLGFVIVLILGLPGFGLPGIRFAPTIGTIALFTAGVGYVAYWRRMLLPAEQRLHASFDVSLAAWREHGSFEKSLAIALTASVMVAAGALAYVILTPTPGDTFTEFYILGRGGNASGYPSALNVSQPATVIMGIASHESVTANYSVRIDLVGVKIVYNATSGFNETVEVNRTTWSTFEVSLADGQKWTQPYTFRINDTGIWKVQFLLFKDGHFSSAYLELHLYVRVV